MIEKLIEMLKLTEEECRYKDICTSYDIKNPECHEEYNDRKEFCYNLKDIDLENQYD